MPKFDIRCNDCSREREVDRSPSEPNPVCESCGGKMATIWKSFPNTERNKDPYDMLDGIIPDGKKIFSGPKVHSK